MLRPIVIFTGTLLTSYIMATTKSKPREKKPLKVQLLNASGKIIEGIIPAGKWPEEDPTLAIAKELSKYNHLKPTPIP